MPSKPISRGASVSSVGSVASSRSGSRASFSQPGSVAHSRKPSVHSRKPSLPSTTAVMGAVSVPSASVASRTSNGTAFLFIPIVNLETSHSSLQQATGVKTPPNASRKPSLKSTTSSRTSLTKPPPASEENQALKVSAQSIEPIVKGPITGQERVKRSAPMRRGSNTSVGSRGSR